MLETIQAHTAEIADLCRRHDVARLEVFGSAADGDHFDPERSDVDFLVEYKRGSDLGPWLGRYFELKEALSRLLGRPVDLVMAHAPRNPFFLREMNRTRRLVYAEQDAEAA